MSHAPICQCAECFGQRLNPTTAPVPTPTDPLPVLRPSELRPEEVARQTFPDGEGVAVDHDKPIGKRHR